jgi:hypothetical protein
MQEHHDLADNLLLRPASTIRLARTGPMPSTSRMRPSKGVGSRRSRNWLKTKNPDFVSLFLNDRSHMPAASDGHGLSVIAMGLSARPV